jgi:hypothetical protein
LHRGVAEADLYVSELVFEPGYPLQHGFEATAGLDRLWALRTLAATP